MPQAHTSDKHRRERNTAAVGESESVEPLRLGAVGGDRQPTPLLLYTKLNPISVTTLTSLMEALTKAVETTIGEEMPDDFGLIIDGWTHVPATVTSPGDGRARRSPQC
ncbi:hypothetical protein PC118_g15451 [Phytophthora cactorum]|uniref:Uncharacterized protein n=1 Tax=Phytophthora cactorum TaxID=29920 RepID=A0A8T1BLS5_9STRA|nr:hypothetical protein PC115_g14929 [Phytophthora cactorum]KAG2972888.1 hypothetical protein PC118_g15451 [Phytophthora cactorum]KAG3002208.1 hypothetical protein PC119_g16410 [Phytophthora cactorum]KAG3009244.1 hypothetical protein PC120_g15732 [Phytophthora cactorum]